MDLSNSVLVVVDMQNGFVNDRSRHVVPAVVELVQRWQETGRDVVFTRFHNYPDSQYERLIGWSRMRVSPEIDVVDELQPYVTNVVDKDYYTLFNDDGIKLVEEHGWTTFVICGIATDSCVLKTATDAFERGYTPIVVTDASASHAGEDKHDAGLMLIGRFIGRPQLVTVDQLFG